MPEVESAKVLIQLSQMFLVPATILVAALAHADNERLKTGVSVLGLMVSVIWWASVGQYYVDCPDLSKSFLKPYWLTAHALPLLFILAWLVSLVIHAYRWKKYGPNGPPAMATGT